MKKIYLLLLIPIIVSCKENNLTNETENQITINSKLKFDEGISEDGEVNYLYNQCLKYLYTDYVKAKMYAEKQLAFSKDKNIFNGEASAYNILGLIEYNNRNYVGALTNYALVLAMFDKISNNIILIDTYGNIASVYQTVDLKFEANLYYNKALDLAHLTDNQPYIAYIHFGLGLVNRNIDKITALNHYNIALKIRQELGDNKGIADCYNEIGNIYFDENQFIQAKEYYLQSLSIIGKSENLALSKNYFNIGLCFKKLNDYDNSFNYHFKSLALDEKLNNQAGAKENYIQLGSLYINKNQYSKAIEALNKAEVIAKALHDNGSLIEISNLLSTCYTATGNITKAEEYRDRSKDIQVDYTREQIKSIVLKNQQQAEVRKFNQGSLVLNHRENPKQIFWVIGILIGLVSGAGMALVGIKRKVKIVEKPMIKLRDPKLVDLSWWHINQLKWIEEEAIESKKLIRGIEAVIKESLDKPTKDVIEVILAELKERLKAIKYWSIATNDIDPTPPPADPKN